MHTHLDRAHASLLTSSTLLSYVRALRAPKKSRAEATNRRMAGMQAGTNAGKREQQAKGATTQEHEHGKTLNTGWKKAKTLFHNGYAFTALFMKQNTYVQSNRETGKHGVTSRYNCPFLSLSCAATHAGWGRCPPAPRWRRATARLWRTCGGRSQRYPREWEPWEEGTRGERRSKYGVQRTGCPVLSAQFIARHRTFIRRLKREIDPMPLLAPNESWVRLLQMKSAQTATHTDTPP